MPIRFRRESVVTATFLLSYEVSLSFGEEEVHLAYTPLL